MANRWMGIYCWAGGQGIFCSIAGQGCNDVETEERERVMRSRWVIVTTLYFEALRKGPMYNRLLHCVPRDEMKYGEC